MKFLLAGALILITYSCYRTDRPIENTEWHLARYTDQNDRTVRQGFSCVMTLIEGESVIRLDVNSCIGSYVLGENNSLDFRDGFGCTKACCDEPKSEEALRLIMACDRYEIKEDQLTLSNRDKVFLVFKAEN